MRLLECLEYWAPSTARPDPVGRHAVRADATLSLLSVYTRRFHRDILVRDVVMLARIPSLYRHPCPPVCASSPVLVIVIGISSNGIGTVISVIMYVLVTNGKSTPQSHRRGHHQVSPMSRNQAKRTSLGRLQYVHTTLSRMKAPKCTWLTTSVGPARCRCKLSESLLFRPSWVGCRVAHARL